MAVSFKYSLSPDDYADKEDYRKVLAKRFQDFTDQWWKLVIHDIDDCYIFDRIWLMYMEYILFKKLYTEVYTGVYPLLAEDFSWLLNENGDPLFAE